MAFHWKRILVIKDDTNSETSDNDTGSEDSDDDSEDSQTHQGRETRSRYSRDKRRRLGKRLAYVLRYGAEVERLEVSAGGYVSLAELLKTHLMRHDSKEDVLKEVDKSYSSRGIKRFEKKVENGSIYVRACYRRMERNPCHDGTKVTRLLEIMINYVADHIRYFDLQDFPDEFLIQSILHRLKQTHQLNNAAFESLLGATIEKLDLSDAVLTVKTLRLLSQRCPHLKELSLKNCGYIVTDHIMEILLQRLRELQSLNLSCCSHLSDRAIKAVVNCCPQIVRLNLSGIPNISQEALLHLVTACEELEHLVISQNENLTPEGKETLTHLTNAHNITLIILLLTVEL